MFERERERGGGVGVSMSFVSHLYSRTINSVKQLISNTRWLVCYYNIKVDNNNKYCSYFPVESTKEMLEEWKPLLCPFDTAMLDGMDYFGEFLPTLMFPEQFNHGYKLWFDELLHIWLESRNNNQLDEVRKKEIGIQ